MPDGFVAAGVECGIKASGKKDLAIIAAETDAVAAVVTTRNQVVGAPVIWCRKILPRGFGRARAFVISSGCSNVCTGKVGLRDAATMARLTAKALNARPARFGASDAGDDARGATRRPSITPENILVASTGVIGRRLPMDKIRAGIAAAAERLGTGGDADVVRAIMTTDAYEKSAVVRTRIGPKTVTVAGIAKGAGMIAPSMATMIAAITTDAAISAAALHKALKSAVAVTFNAITVDSDTSTSDTVAVLAGGAAGNRKLTARSPGCEYEKFAAALREVCAKLARAIVADGEGATKVVEIVVSGARSDAEAEIAAKSVGNSPLFKCAVGGGDPNWGRIVAALGKSSARVDPDRLRIAIGGATVFARGTGRKFDLGKIKKRLQGKDITIACDLGLGRGSFTALTCDLTHRYVTINADYHT